MDRTPLDAIARAIRREREGAGLTLSGLARKAGVAKSTLSQLESGAGNPSVETLWALAVALGVPFSRLVDPPTPPPHVVRAGAGPAVRSEQARFSAILLAACPPQARRDLHLITLEPGAVRTAKPHLPGTVEHLVLTAGRVRAGPVAAEIVLDPGDYARFAGDVPHSYEALAEGSAGVLVMEHR